MSGFYVPKRLEDAPFSLGGLFSEEDDEGNEMEQNHEVFCRCVWPKRKGDGAEFMLCFCRCVWPKRKGGVFCLILGMHHDLWT
jgi:hypothetical protein